MQKSGHIWFMVILITGLIIRLLFLSEQKPFQQRNYMGVHPDSTNATIYKDATLWDEMAHWNYITIVRDKHQLPDFAWCKSCRNDSYTYENYQFPLYYIFQSIVSFGSPQIARFWNVILCLMAVTLIWLASKNLYAVAFIMLLPAPLEFLTYISNDIAIFLAAAVLAYGLHKKSFVWYAVGLFLCATTKMQGLFICGAMVLWFWKNERYRWSAIIACVLGSLIFVERYSLSTVNGSSFLGWDEPSLLLMSILSKSLFSAIVSDRIPSAFVHQYIPVMIAIVLFVGYASYKAFAVKPLSVYTFAAGAVMLTWFMFVVNHPWHPGRLLYPMIPFVAANWREFGQNKVKPGSGKSGSKINKPD